MSEFSDLLAASIDEIEAALRDPEREEGEVLVEEYAEQKGISVPQARRDLESGVVSERLSKRRLKIGRTWKAIYKVAK